MNRLNAYETDSFVNAIRATVAPLDQLEQILPVLLQNLSIGRSQIAVDQLRSAVTEDRRQVVLVTAVDQAGDETMPLAAAIVLHPLDSESGIRSEAATFVHAGPLVPMDEPLMGITLCELRQVVDRVLHDRGVRFVQWATDPRMDRDTVAESGKPSERGSESCAQIDHGNSVTKWCDSLGFGPIAHLEYLAGSINSTESNAEHADYRGEVSFQGIDWDDGDALPHDLADLVESTYVDTLDCPQLAKFRSAQQTLISYRQSAAFDARLWFRVFDTGPASGQPIGCVILANHSADESADGGVIELVYMGLVPQARGRGLGRAVLDRAIGIAREFGADRMIMAVDLQNGPARRLYQDAGFTSLLIETVWVRSLDRENHSRPFPGT